MKVRVHMVALVTGVVAVATVTTAVLVSKGPAPKAPEASAGPIDGKVHTISLRTVGTTATAPAQSTSGFSLLGVMWDAPRAQLRGNVRVRTRSAATGAWSAWRRVTVLNDDGSDGRERARHGATNPLWVGPSNGVAVRVAGRRTLPKGLSVVLVDPGSKRRRVIRATPAHAAGQHPPRMALAAATISPSASPTDSPSPSTTAPSDTPTPTPSPSTTSPTPSPSSSAPTTSTAPRPAIVSRSQWGADESLVKDPPSYGTAVKVVFTHHTDTGNSYSCSDSPAVIRSIMTYHVQTNGWNDIGYNFLVDKCGTLFEGRAGGVDRPVIGAHAYGFNTNSSGVAVLGTYTDVAPPQAALDTIAKLAAWKLGLDGGDPTGTATLVEGATDGKFPYQSTVTFNTIAGHRDANTTTCPGLIYDQLGGIRTAAKQWMTPADMSTTSLSGATKVSTAYYTKGTVTLRWPAAAVSGYDLLDNGTAIAHPAASALSTTTTLAAGTHQLQVVAHNLNGTTANSVEFPVVADTTKPVFTSPAALSVRTGTVSSSQVPVSLKWKATDNRLLQSVKATSPSAKTFAPTTTSWSAYAHPSTSTLWSLTAADAAGNTATSSITRTAALRTDGSSTRSGTWKTTSSTSYLGGSALYSGSAGATASWTVTGRSVGLITKRATNSGKFYVYVDGVYAATIDTQASSTLYKQIQWTRAWSSSGSHTIKIKVAGTSGRPTVTIDGLAYIG